MGKWGGGRRSSLTIIMSSSIKETNRRGREGGGINSVTKQKVRSRVDCMEKLKQYFVTEILGLGGTIGVCI